MAVLLVLLLPLAAAQEAAFTFVLPSPVIYGVPFAAEVQVDSDNINFIDYDLSVGSSSNRVSFSAAQLSRADPFQLAAALSGSPGGGASYRVRTETNGNVMSSSAATRLFTLSNLYLSGQEGTDANGLELLFSATSQSITAAQSGTTFTLQPEESMSFSPEISVCGDGVVGYADTNSNGIEDEGESREACDDGNGVDKDGCAAQCDYVELGWECRNTEFGQRQSECTKLQAREFLIQKVTALVNGECYPDCAHPQALYLDDADARRADRQPRLQYQNGQLDTQQKIYLIAQLGAALNEFFRSGILSTTAGDGSGTQAPVVPGSPPPANP